MEALVAIVVAIVLLVLIDVAADRWGAESRPGFLDDRQV
jgi:hypothetical protein